MRYKDFISKIISIKLYKTEADLVDAGNKKEEIVIILIKTKPMEEKSRKIMGRRIMREKIREKRN